MMSIRYVALSLSLIASGALAQTTVPAWTYAINITTDSGNGAPNRGSMAIRYQSSATVLRMELIQIAGSANRITGGEDISGTYTLMNDTDSTYATVMPAQHAVMIMQSPVQMLADRPKPTVDINARTQSVEDLGPGDKIMGHATHRYRVTTTGGMTMKTGDQVCTRSMDGESEVWIAPDVDIRPAMMAALAHYGGVAPDVTTTGSATSSSTSIPMKGVPLRTKMRQTVVLPSGESRVVETTMEYVELSNKPLDSSLFTIPSDYQVMDMRKQMPAIMAKVKKASEDSVRERPAGCR